MTAPAVDCLAPKGAQLSALVTASWDYVPGIGADGVWKPQASAQVNVVSLAESQRMDFDPDHVDAVVAGSVSDATTTLTMPQGIGPGSYVCYIEATDTEGVKSGWCSTPFVVAQLNVATRPSNVLAGSLGCGSTVVRVQTRGGGKVLADVPFATVAYGRKIDDMTDCQLSIAADGLKDERCCLALNGLRAWEHEVAIWRDDPEEAWIGVVGEPQFDFASVHVPARDLFQWFERRSLVHDRTFTGADLGQIFYQYALDALERENSMGIVIEPYMAGTTGDRTITGSARPRAADELRELARTGVDFTMIGRRLLFGGEELPVNPLPTLTDDMVSDPSLVVRGLDVATEFAVIGATDENIKIPHSGVAGGINPALGLVQTTVNESNIKDDLSCAEAAQTRLDLYSTGAEFLTARLRPEAPVRFADLIPGARWPVALRVACREVIGVMRLAEVAVSASAEEGGQTEAVTVTLEPLGTVDLEAVSP